MSIDKLNQIWEKLQKNQDPSSENSAPNTFGSLFNTKPKWSCNAACDGACRWNPEDELERSNTP